jgi:hypothetical protein
MAARAGISSMRQPVSRAGRRGGAVEVVIFVGVVEHQAAGVVDVALGRQVLGEDDVGTCELDMEVADRAGNGCRG